MVVEKEGINLYNDPGALFWECPLCRKEVAWEKNDYGDGDVEVIDRCDCGTWEISIRAELRRGDGN